MEIIVKTLKGLEPVLAKELDEIGADDIEIINRGARCYGNQSLLYKCNLRLRTALRVLVPIHECIVHTERDLYRKMRKFEWSEYLDMNQTFAIDAVVHSRTLNHSKFVALRVKDALVDQFRDKLGDRPNVDVKRPDVRFNVHVADKKLTLLLDSSGFSLHRRSYRVDGHEAPINEVLAAGLLLSASYHGYQRLLDPMCGSGTIPIEAALIASNKAPHRDSTRFAFKQWSNYDEALWEKVCSSARKEEKETEHGIEGSDISGKYIRIAKEAAQNAGVDEYISFSTTTFFEREDDPENLLIVTNPPYDERIQSQDIIKLYKRIGDAFKFNYPGAEAWVISSNMQALKHIGLRPSKKLPLMNASLECKAHYYQMYKGSKKEQ